MDSAIATTFLPAEPRSIEDTGLTPSFLSNLALKILYQRGVLSGHDIAAALHVPFANVVDHALDFLRREHLVEVRGSSGFGESSYQYTISDAGRIRAREVMNDNGYVGPAPVPLDTYSQAVKLQSLANHPISPDQVRAATRHLIFDESVLAQLGPAVNSAKSIFLHGHPGNGKTALSEAIGAMLDGQILIPHAIAADGSIIKLFDPLNHRPVAEAEDSPCPPGLKRGERYDRRWALIRRPAIIVGGELTLEALDLTLDATTKFFEAPYQMKANGGTFLIDDFGRQQVRPRELLNRWIMPLEKRVDFLTLASGRKLEVPFDALILFATNMNPSELVDEAFLRRIRYKIELPDPNWDQYREIFRRVARDRNVPYTDEGLRYLVTEYYLKPRRQPRAVHPRDILEELVDIARYAGVPPVLSPALVDQACRSYFLHG